MKKIPTMMRRDPDNPARVLAEVTPGCEWVLLGEAVAYRKHDGLCVLIAYSASARRTYTRRLVKPHQKTPDNFTQTDHDPNTGNRFGWIPSEESGYQKFLEEALAQPSTRQPWPWNAGTYELCGPKINHNGEKLDSHHLLPHVGDRWDTYLTSFPVDLDDIKRQVTVLAGRGWEGIVWHHPDGRMAKIKARDFGVKVA